MKKYFVSVMALALTISLNSCSNDESVKIIDENESRLKALQTFDESFNASFDFFLTTRSSIANTSEDGMDSTMKAVGENVCETLILPSEILLSEFGFTEEVFNEVVQEMLEEKIIEECIPIRELKCYTALAIYEIYKNENEQIGTRASYLDYVGCIGIGTTVKELEAFTTAQLAKLAARRLATRFIPYVGWGWAAASAAYCMSGL